MSTDPRQDPAEALPEVAYRLATEADFQIIKEYYALLNQHFYSFGYRLPHPENVGEIYLDSFRRTLGKFSNAWVAEVDGAVAADNPSSGARSADATLLIFTGQFRRPHQRGTSPQGPNGRAMG